ncbi:MAG: Uma2 family endonuclease [Thermoanaerobaculia bacterium]
MSKAAAVTLDDEIRIPAEAFRFEFFRRWSRSEDFPERGRIDYLEGEVEVDMSPEDLYTHGVVKTTLAAELHALVAVPGHGAVFVDSTRVTVPETGLSAEPDVVAVTWKRLQSGQVREVPAVGKAPGRFVELEGAPDFVVEIVSDSSVKKDLRRLPGLYARSGIPELWIVDARGEELVFRIAALAGSRYRRLAPDREGWLESPFLGRRVRLIRELNVHSRWQYRLEHQ